MIESLTLDDVAALAERVDVECKSALGRDGRGELTDDFWKTYSAMANGEGGVVWLGIQEKPRGKFTAVGLADVERVRKALWDNLHNRKQVSINLLTEAHVQPVDVDGRTVLRVEVPRGPRRAKPVHLGSNPFGGTYVRRHEGDYTADDEDVRRMLAERVEDSREERILKGFDFGDLDMDTVSAYRNRFAALHAGLPGAARGAARAPLGGPAGAGRQLVGERLRLLPPRVPKADGRSEDAVPVAGRAAHRRLSPA